MSRSFKRKYCTYLSVPKISIELQSESKKEIDMEKA